MENNSNLTQCSDNNKNNNSNNITPTPDSQNEKIKTESQPQKDKENKIKIDSDKPTKINYFSYIKEFLAKKRNDQGYSDIIKENPDSLFENMSEQRLVIWESILYCTSAPLRKNSECDIFCTPMEREDQNVIRNDSRRTRVRESILVPGYSKILEAILF